MDTISNMSFKLEASQATMVFKYQNVKMQLLKTNLHIKFNKFCLFHNLTPKYAIINIRSSSKSVNVTIKHAQTFYIKEEIKSLYTKKSILNKQLLKLHLQMLNSIHPAIINNVLDSCLLYTSRCV